MRLPETSGSRPLQILLLYEDLATGSRALTAVDDIFRNLPVRAAFELKLRAVRWLGFEPLRAECAAVAARADLTVLSLHTPAAINAGLEAWTRLWTERNRHAVCALAVLFDRDQQHTPAAQEAVQRLRGWVHNGSIDVLNGVKAPAEWDVLTPARRMHPCPSPPSWDRCTEETSHAQHATLAVNRLPP